jgi:hypothetical protein
MGRERYFRTEMHHRGGRKFVGRIRHLFAAHAKWSSLIEAACNGDVICSGF